MTLKLARVSHCATSNKAVLQEAQTEKRYTPTRNETPKHSWPATRTPIKDTTALVTLQSNRSLCNEIY